MPQEEKIQVTGTVEQGVLVLTITYGPEQMLQQDAATRLSREIVQHYKTLLNDSAETLRTRSAVVVIKSKMAGSPLVRALFELYKEVNSGGGQVICVGYPSDYIDSLTTMGLPALDGFSLSPSKGEALTKLA